MAGPVAVLLDWESASTHRAVRALSGHRMLPAIVWVLADNHHARRFYEAMRGREVARGKVVVGDQLLDKVAYIWADYLPWPEWAL